MTSSAWCAETVVPVVMVVSVETVVVPVVVPAEAPMQSMRLVSCQTRVGLDNDLDAGLPGQQVAAVVGALAPMTVAMVPMETMAIKRSSYSGWSLVTQ